jgi:plasmid stabilization system protein ParE
MDDASSEADALPPILVRPIAEEEIAEAFRWYEDKSEGLGSEFMRALDASLASIQRNPLAYAVVHKQIRRAVLRRFPYGVFYLFENDIVIVIACFHASRSPKQWRKRA